MGVPYKGWLLTVMKVMKANCSFERLAYEIAVLRVRPGYVLKPWCMLQTVRNFSIRFSTFFSSVFNVGLHQVAPPVLADSLFLTTLFETSCD